MVHIWLYDQLDFRLEGKIIVSLDHARCWSRSEAWPLTRLPDASRPQGFDEFMNVVLDDAQEVWVKSKKATAHRDAVEKGTKNPLGALRLRRGFRACPLAKVLC